MSPCDEDDVAQQRLAPEQVKCRIEEGRARRAQLKKGTVKRPLGNARAMVAGVFISTVAVTGAAIEAVPSSSRVRPDVLEVCDGLPKVSLSFSRWGWRTSEPVKIDSDWRDRDAQDELARWIDSSQPRLVIMSNCCPKSPVVGPQHRNPSQAESRAKKWRDRQKSAV